MPSERYDEKRHKVDIEAAWQNASLSVIRNAKAELPGLPELLPGLVRKRPTVIYDINGSPLFYDFRVSLGRETGGYVRAAASRVLGPPVAAVELGARSWNFNAAVKSLMPKVRRGRRGLRIPRPKLVCYSYPKLGVMFELPDARGRVKRQIFDVASLEPVRELPAGSQREGAYAWSFYGQLDNRQRSRRLKRYEGGDKLRVKQSASFLKKVAKAKSLDRVIDSAKLRFKPRVKKLEFCPHYPTTHGRSHHCFVLHGQEVNDYCAVATCQMILCYYRYYYDQDDIAPSLGYSSGGGCPSDQSAGYEALTGNHLIATFDGSASWSEAKSEIDRLHPMKSGITGHARACAGYSSILNLWPLRITDRQLYVYDPWPWDSDYRVAGTVYWEDWDSIHHTNFIYTELDY